MRVARSVLRPRDRDDPVGSPRGVLSLLRHLDNCSTLLHKVLDDGARAPQDGGHNVVRDKELVRNVGPATSGGGSVPARGRRGGRSGAVGSVLLILPITIGPLLLSVGRLLPIGRVRVGRGGLLPLLLPVPTILLLLAVGSVGVLMVPAIPLLGRGRPIPTAVPTIPSVAPHWGAATRGAVATTAVAHGMLIVCGVVCEADRGVLGNLVDDCLGGVDDTGDGAHDSQDALVHTRDLLLLGGQGNLGAAVLLELLDVFAPLADDLPGSLLGDEHAKGDLPLLASRGIILQALCVAENLLEHQLRASRHLGGLSREEHDAVLCSGEVLVGV